MKKLLPAPYSRTLGIRAPVAASFLFLFSFFFPVLSVVSCIKLLILSEKAFLCTTEQANQQQSANSIVLLYFSVHSILFIVIPLILNSPFGAHFSYYAISIHAIYMFCPQELEILHPLPTCLQLIVDFLCCSRNCYFFSHARTPDDNGGV